MEIRNALLGHSVPSLCETVRSVLGVRQSDCPRRAAVHGLGDGLLFSPNLNCLNISLFGLKAPPGQGPNLKIELVHC